MAKRIDINSFQNRFERDGSRNKRAVGTRNLRVYFLIVCEGQKTEPHYFSSFNNSLPPYTFDTTEYVKHNPCTMVFRLVDELNNPGKVLNK